MALMRDVFPIDFDSRGLATREAARDAVQALHDAGLLAAGDHIMFTSGDHMEHRGATNTLRLLEVGKGGSAEGLGEREAKERKSVGWGTSVSVRVDLGGP